MMTDEKTVNAAYEFITGGEGDFMLVMEAPDNDNADDENAKFIYDGVSKAKLLRKRGQIINIPAVPEPLRGMLKSRGLLLVTEMDGDDIYDVYEAKIEILTAKEAFIADIKK